jgi:hypothetical protein
VPAQFNGTFERPIEGAGYGLFFQGHRVTLTKEQLKTCLTALNVELVKTNGGSYRFVAKKKGPAATGPQPKKG